VPLASSRRGPRLGVVFGEEDLEEDPAAEPAEPEGAAGPDDAEALHASDEDALSFADDVEAEVAELLGEVPVSGEDDEADEPEH
jgi:hypothetical protein